MKGKEIVKKSVIGILVLFVVIQCFRPTKNNGVLESPNDVSHVVHIPDNIKLILNTACYDCHSNHTKYPWYTEIMPVGWWLNHHIEEGKEHLNFSEFKNYDSAKQDHKLEEIAEEVAEREMPLSSYSAIHREANLTEEQVKMLVDWATTARKEIIAR